MPIMGSMQMQGEMQSINARLEAAVKASDGVAQAPAAGPVLAERTKARTIQHMRGCGCCDSN